MRGKCKRNTRRVEKVSLLSSAAESSIRGSSSKSARRLLGKVLAVTTCTNMKGETQVVKATVKKGKAARENSFFPPVRRARRASPPPPPMQDESMWQAAYPDAFPTQSAPSASSAPDEGWMTSDRTLYEE